MPLAPVVQKVDTVNPPLSFPGGLIISSPFEGGLNRDGGLIRKGGLISFKNDNGISSP